MIEELQASKTITLGLPGCTGPQTAVVDTPEQILAAAGHIAMALGNKEVGSRLLAKSKAKDSTSLAEAKQRLGVQLAALSDSIVAKMGPAQRKAKDAAANHFVRKPGQRPEGAIKTRSTYENAQKHLDELKKDLLRVSEALGTLA